MTDHKIAQTHGIAQGLLNDIFQEPNDIFIAPVEVSYSIAPSYHTQGRYCVWHWDFIESPDIYQAFLVEIGLDSQTSAPVTIRTRDEVGDFTVVNATAHRPIPNEDMKWTNYFLRDVNMYFTDIFE